MPDEQPDPPYLLRFPREHWESVKRAYQDGFEDGINSRDDDEQEGDE